MHRAHQLLQKQYLIIHPTADGTGALPRQLTWEMWHFMSLFPLFSAEKVHFQHTAKLINHLISEKANYTLQVRLRPRRSFPPANVLTRTGWTSGDGNHGNVCI